MADDVRPEGVPTELGSTPAGAGAGSAPAFRSAGMKLKDRYVIEREIGHGGFGVVYLARDEQLHSRRVVIKVLLDRSAEERGWLLKKFGQEREALARLDHPGIVGMLDAGEMPGGQPFLVMQYVDGITLRAELRKGPMPLERVGEILSQMGRALSAAHDRNICHRDLKPENVMLHDVGGGQEVVKIIDFGIASVLESDTDEVLTTRIAGSPLYMAPEQLVAKPRKESDTYAMGVMAYEMVTGKRPFPAESMFGLYALQQMGVETPPRSLRPDLPPEAERAILKALAFKPEDRFANARDFGDLVGEAVRVNRAMPVTARWKPSRRAVLATALAAPVLLLLPFLGRFLSTPPETPKTAQPARRLDYSILVQKYKDRKPAGAPFLLPGEIIFEAGYRIRLLLKSPQPGHLYVLNEGPVQAGAVPAYNVLYPGERQESAVGAGKQIEIPSSGSDWIVFDEQEGTEKLWMIWAAQGVSELEAAKRFANAEHVGAVNDPAVAGGIQKFLAAHQPNAAAKRDDAKRLTSLDAQGDVLVRIVNLEHH